MNRLDWQPIGHVALDSGDRLKFPKASSRPGVYRIDFDRAGRKSVYVGETDQFDRRFQQYRTPGPSQWTNLRLNALIRETLKVGGAVSVEIVGGDMVVDADGRERPVDLSQKPERLRLERAALVAIRDTGVDVLNA